MTTKICIFVFNNSLTLSLCPPPYPKNRVVCEIMWENIVERAGHRWQCGACALHAGCLKLQIKTKRNNYCFSTVTMLARTRLGVTLYTRARVCIAICGLPALQCFPTLSHKQHDFSGVGGVTEHKTSVVIFNTSCVWKKKNFILRRNGRDMI